MEFATQSETAPPGGHALTFDGTAGLFAPLVLKNAVLRVITLLIYRFWAVTAERRLLWRSTLLDDDRFEYTGTGKEIFLGFLIVVAVVIAPLIALDQYSRVLIFQGNVAGGALQGVLVLVVLFLIGVAQYRARRYRLSRTLWRGIRMAQSGSAVSYGLAQFLFLLSLPLTLGLSYPWMAVSLFRRRMTNTSFGDRRFAFSGQAATLFKPYLRFWLLNAVLLGTAIGLTLTTADAVRQPDGSIRFHGGYGFFVVLLWLLVLPFSWAWLKARMYEQFVERLELEGARFRFDAITPNYIGLTLGNYLIVLGTLGLGMAFANMRTFAFVARHLHIDGTLDFAAIAQSAEPVDRTGEGLADAFEIGGL